MVKSFLDYGGVATSREVYENTSLKPADVLRFYPKSATKQQKTQWMKEEKALYATILKERRSSKGKFSPHYEVDYQHPHVEVLEGEGPAIVLKELGGGPMTRWADKPPPPKSRPRKKVDSKPLRVCFAGPYAGKTTAAAQDKRFCDIDGLPTEQQRERLDGLIAAALAGGQWEPVNALWREITRSAPRTKILLAHAPDQLEGSSPVDYVVLGYFRVADVASLPPGTRAQAAQQYELDFPSATPVPQDTSIPQLLLASAAAKKRKSRRQVELPVNPAKLQRDTDPFPAFVRKQKKIQAKPKEKIPVLTWPCELPAKPCVIQCSVADMAAALQAIKECPDITLVAEGSGIRISKRNPKGAIKRRFIWGPAGTGVGISVEGVVHEDCLVSSRDTLIKALPFLIRQYVFEGRTFPELRKFSTPTTATMLRAELGAASLYFYEPGANNVIVGAGVVLDPDSSALRMSKGGFAFGADYTYGSVSLMDSNTGLMSIMMGISFGRTGMAAVSRRGLHVPIHCFLDFAALPAWVFNSMALGYVGVFVLGSDQGPREATLKALREISVTQNLFPGLAYVPHFTSDLISRLSLLPEWLLRYHRVFRLTLLSSTGLPIKPEITRKLGLPALQLEALSASGCKLHKYFDVSKLTRELRNRLLVYYNKRLSGHSDPAVALQLIQEIRDLTGEYRTALFAPEEAGVTTTPVLQTPTVWIKDAEGITGTELKSLCELTFEAAERRERTGYVFLALACLSIGDSPAAVGIVMDAFMQFANTAKYSVRAVYVQCEQVSEQSEESSASLSRAGICFGPPLSEEQQLQKRAEGILVF